MTQSRCAHFNIISYTNESYLAGLLPVCAGWKDPQHILFQLANACFVISYASPSSIYGVLFMHSALIFGEYFFCVLINSRFELSTHNRDLSRS